MNHFTISRCKTGQCIQLTSVCDEKLDCYDGSDEGGRCLTACFDKNPCSHHCQNTPLGPICSCKDGFQLKGDGLSCVDKNECEIQPPLCSQLCHNLEGSYQCECFDDFQLR